MDRTRGSGTTAVRGRPIESTSPMCFTTPPPTTPLVARVAQKQKCAATCGGAAGGVLGLVGPASTGGAVGDDALPPFPELKGLLSGPGIEQHLTGGSPHHVKTPRCDSRTGRSPSDLHPHGTATAATGAAYSSAAAAAATNANHAAANHKMDQFDRMLRSNPNLSSGRTPLPNDAPTEQQPSNNVRSIVQSVTADEGRKRQLIQDLSKLLFEQGGAKAAGAGTGAVPTAGSGGAVDASSQPPPPQVVNVTSIAHMPRSKPTTPSAAADIVPTGDSGILKMRSVAGGSPPMSSVPTAVPSAGGGNGMSAAAAAAAVGVAGAPAERGSIERELITISKSIHFDASAVPQKFTQRLTRSDESAGLYRPKPSTSQACKFSDELRRRARVTSRRLTRSIGSAFSETNTESSIGTSAAYSTCSRGARAGAALKPPSGSK